MTSKHRVINGWLINVISPLNDDECASLEDYLIENVVKVRNLDDEDASVEEPPKGTPVEATVMAYKFDTSLDGNEKELDKLNAQIIEAGRVWMGFGKTQ
jgi:hypothetical protein